MQPPSRIPSNGSLRGQVSLVALAVSLTCVTSPVGFGQEIPAQTSQVRATSRPDVNGRPTIVRVRYFVIGLREIDGARQTFDADIFWRFRWLYPACVLALAWFTLGA